MKCTVLKAFPFSANGVTIAQLAVGDTPDIPRSQVWGLAEAGYIRPDEDTAGLGPSSAASNLPLETPENSGHISAAEIARSVREKNEAAAKAAGEPEVDPELATLREQYETIAKKPADLSWDVDQIKTELLNADPDADAAKLDKLRAEFKKLAGQDADGRWAADRIQTEIDALKNKKA